jgi:hypothetical protein
MPDGQQSEAAENMIRGIDFCKQEMPQEQRSHALYFGLLEKVVPCLKTSAGLDKEFLLKWMRFYSGAEVEERKHRITLFHPGR